MVGENRGEYDEGVQLSELIHAPNGDHWDGGSFACPDCGKKIKRPFGGHTWTCHEGYGGCGAQFTPIKVLKRVNDE